MFQKLIDMFVLKNKKTGNPSYSLTMTVVAFGIINIKLLFSGVEFGTFFKMSDFSGVDYAAALAAVSALHISNKAINKKGIKSDGN